MDKADKQLIEKLAGKFIVIDGPDGVGKSTQIRMLSEYLRSGGVEVNETRDPGGTVIGDKIRAILLDRSNHIMTVGCEILLYMASRTQLMGEVIGPAIQQGKCVLCDRWVSSTVAYQVAEGQATKREVMDTYTIALKDVSPDLTVILDLPAETGLERITGTKDRMEVKPLKFHQEVRRLFLEQAKDFPELYAVLVATGQIDEVQQKLRTLILNWNFSQ